MASDTFNQNGERKLLHDISTPLSILIFQIETVLKQTTVLELRERLQKALIQAKKIAELLEGRREKVSKEK